jgi:hypothetical protein
MFAFASHSLLFALRAGEVNRIARTAAMMGAYLCTTPGFARQWAQRLFGLADDISRDADDPYLLAFLTLAKGFGHYLEGRWRSGCDLCDGSIEMFRDTCSGVAWEIDAAHTFALWSLICLGEVGEIRRRRERLAREAHSRGDLFLLTNLNTFLLAYDRAGADQASEGCREIQQTMEGWSRENFDVQHHNRVLGESLLSLYLENGVAAWRCAHDQWSRYRESMLIHIQQVRIDVSQTRGRGAVAAAAQARDPRPFLKDAARMARALRRERMLYPLAFAQLIQAGIAAVQNREHEAMQRLEQAAASFQALNMNLFSAACRHRLGHLLGGDQGKQLKHESEIWMQEHGVVNPGRMAAALVTGFHA